MTTFYRSLVFLITVSFAVTVCASQLWARESRLSGAVSLLNKSRAIESFLRNPGPSYVQAYMRFGPDMPDDVIIAIDHEFIEGVNKPHYVKGGDWMAYVGVQRSGGVWVAAGTDDTLKGNPSNDRNWKILDLKTRLEPNVWYRLRVEADFGTRHFKSFTIEGPGINQTLDLSNYTLDYPNYMPFSERTMGYYVAAMRGRGMMKVEGVPIVYFDDVEGGVWDSRGRPQRVFFSSFENQSGVPRQPLTSPVINLNGYEQGKWYLERDESLVHIEYVPFAHSGTRVGVVDANLN